MWPLVGSSALPLRLLEARVYDRVVAIKGDKQVALLTGEERIARRKRAISRHCQSMPVPSGKTPSQTNSSAISPRRD